MKKLTVLYNKNNKQTINVLCLCQPINILNKKVIIKELTSNYKINNKQTINILCLC